MKIISLILIACCVLYGSRLTGAHPLDSTIDGLKYALTDLYDSLDIFTALLSSVPVEGMEYSADVIKTLHQTTIELVNDIYATVKFVYENDDEEYNDESIKQAFREITKTVAYSSGLKDTLNKVVEAVSGLEPKESCPILPIGPPRVYGSYTEMKAASNKSEHEKFVENVVHSIQAGTASIGTISEIFLGLMHGEVPNGKVNAVQELIHTLLTSLNMTFDEVLVATDGLYDIAMYESPAIISESNIIRLRTEAVRDSVTALSRLMLN